ncbi:TPA: hypothetical protein QDB40_002655 [Burkholderia vietnamiensis]|nr:hypothetical protein [Burkholderia vietnamiensis]HDR9168676.1 hypothetical protein [Burkholderia vietnamiensis]
MDTPFAIWVELFPYEITADTIKEFGFKKLYFDFLETDSALDESDSEEPTISFEDFCEALDDMAMLNAAEKSLKTLAGLSLPLTTLVNALNAANEIDEDDIDEDDIATLAEHFRIDGTTIMAVGIVVKAGQEDALLDQYEAKADRLLDRVMPMLVNLDAATLEQALAAHAAFWAALETWHANWTETVTCKRVEHDPAFNPFATKTEASIAAAHGVSKDMMRCTDAINHWIGPVGLDEVRVRFAERLIADGRDPADPDTVYARAALAALPADDGTVDRIIAAARAYGEAEATWCLDGKFDECNADTSARPEDQPAYVAFTERLLASIVAEHGVTVAQLQHAVTTGAQYIGHDNILARRWKRLAPRVAAAIAALN